ncbi:MAG TPA: carbon-nitrogen hydrolase family protein [Ignavibacteria bacterium]|nr:carbon-nitrogen hydrolase family protein [Ignavibacteria bacterium]HMR40408.1 carbon-nitrogen hydrolase family protein [Ignavibacteria bacterium]
MNGKLKIALLQISSFKSDQKGNLFKGEEYCRKAKKEGADIILFPEMWNIGYESIDESVFEIGFDPENIPESIKRKVKIWKSYALDQNSEFITHFKDLAVELDTAIAITYLQKGKTKPFNTVSLIDRYGDIVLNYSKVHTCDFSMEYYCESGDKFRVCELETKKGNVKVGAMICFDREFPESARELMLLGAEIILIPNCCEMDSHRTAQLKTRSFENMTGIALANYPSPKCNGRSQAYSPVAYDKYGKELDNLILMADNEEGIFYADFDLKKIREYRKREVWGNNFRKPYAYKNINRNMKINKK